MVKNVLLSSPNKVFLFFKVTNMSLFEHKILFILVYWYFSLTQ